MPNMGVVRRAHHDPPNQLHRPLTHQSGGTHARGRNPHGNYKIQRFGAARMKKVVDMDLQAAFDHMAKRINELEDVCAASIEINKLCIRAFVDADITTLEIMTSALKEIGAYRPGTVEILDAIITGLEGASAQEETKQPHLTLLHGLKSDPERSEPT